MLDLDEKDRMILRGLQLDASQSYNKLGTVAGLSTAATHERVRRLRERGLIRSTTIDVDPGAIGRGVLAYVLLRATEWMGDASTRQALLQIPAIQEAHIIAGNATLLLKIRARSMRDLQNTLRELHQIPGASGTETYAVLDTFFERPVAITEPEASP